MTTPPSKIKSELAPMVVKISRKVIPASMTYEAYVAVYKELLEYIRSIKPTERPGLCRDAELTFLSDQAKLQKYLKVSNGKLPATKRRIHLALDRIRRMNGEFTSPSPKSAESDYASSLPAPLIHTDINCMDSTGASFEDDNMSVDETAQVGKTSTDATSQRQPTPAKSTAVRMECIASPSVPLSAGFEVDGNGSMTIKLEVRDSPATTRASSPAADVVSQQTQHDEPDEEKGIATLIAMRRNKINNTNSVDMAIPAPLPTKAINTTYHSNSKAFPEKLSSLPSSHPYYRSQRVLASPASARPPTLAHTPIPARPPMSASLPRALSDLQLRQDGKFRPALSGLTSPTRHHQAAASPTPLSAHIALDSPRGSPRIFIPPPPSLTPATGGPIKHHRTTSDFGPSSAAASRLHFIPPPASRPVAGSSTPTRRYILPPPAASPSMRRRFLPRSPPNYHPYAERDELPSPSPHKESFLRSEPTPPPPRKNLVYQPCGSVETRRVSPNGSQEQMASTGRRVNIPPPSQAVQHVRISPNGDRQVAHNPLKRSHTDSEGMSGGQMRFIDPPAVPRSKRSRSDSGSDGESTTSGSSSKSGQRMRFIAPPHRPAMPQSNHKSWGPSRTSPPAAHRQLGPSARPADHGMDSIGGGSILNALINEVQGAQGAVDKTGNDEAAKALEDVAARLAQLAQKMRRSR